MYNFWKRALMNDYDLDSWIRNRWSSNSIRERRSDGSLFMLCLSVLIDAVMSYIFCSILFCFYLISYAQFYNMCMLCSSAIFCSGNFYIFCSILLCSELFHFLIRFKSIPSYYVYFLFSFLQCCTALICMLLSCTILSLF